MIDDIREIVPHVVGATDATAYAIITIRGKAWWVCINDDGTPFFLSNDNV